MGQSTVNYYNNRYKGNLTDQQCGVLEEIIELNQLNGELSDLSHIIYELKKSDVIQLIEDYGLFNKSMHPFEKTLGTLRGYQTLGVAFMYTAVNCILGDSVGLGKTAEVAGLINLLTEEYKKNGKEFKFLYLADKYNAPQARAEFVRFCGTYVNLLTNGEEKSTQDYISRQQDYGVQYSLVGTHSLINQKVFQSWLIQQNSAGTFPFDLLVIDESSILGGAKSNQIVRNFVAMRKFFKRIVFLNATPIETKLATFYNQLDLLDQRFLPTKKNFEKEYQVMDYTGMFPKFNGKYKNEAVFHEAVLYRYFARTRKEKGAEIKDCKGGVLVSDLSPVQKTWLAKTQMPQLVYDCPTYFDPNIAFNESNIPKLQDLLDILKVAFNESDTVLVFTHYKETQYCLSDWLTQKGYSNRVLNGDTPDKYKANIVAGFQQSDFQVLITNVQKGLNFGNCDYCIFYGYRTNPATLLQSEGRITRDFDIIGKNIYLLCSKGREYTTLSTAVKSRAQAISDFAKADISIIMSILLGGDLYNDFEKE